MNYQFEYRESAATFSPDRRYRYVLQRTWERSDGLNHDHVHFVCLNPSTATVDQDDPTVRKCVGFAKHWGYRGMVLTNLFAWRATDPRHLKAVEEPIAHIEEAKNKWIRFAHQECNRTIVAWGTHGRLRNRDHIVTQILLAIRPAWCLGTTQRGDPRHPLYLPYETPREEFRPVQSQELSRKEKG